MFKNVSSVDADSFTAVTSAQTGTYVVYGSSAGYVGATFGLIVESSGANTKVAGSYVYTAIVQTYSGGVLTNTQTADLTFTISATAATLALANGTIDPSKTTAVMNLGDFSSSGTLSANDSAVAVLATAAATNHATIQVKTYTSTSLAAPESVTVTLTGAGTICTSDSVCGNNLTITGAGGDNKFYVRANGTAGTGSIVVKTTTKTFPAKTVSFYAVSPSTITVSVNKPVIGVAAATTNTDVVRAVAKDANGIVWGGQLYVVASTAADALIAGSATTPTACTFNSTYGYHACPLKGTAKGTASVKVMDASLDTDGTIATTDAAVTSSAASVRVSTGSASSVKIAFDKSTYNPGDLAIITIAVLDENGDAMPAGAISNVFAATPTTNVALSSGGNFSSNISTTVTLAGNTDATTDTANPTIAGAQTFLAYMPIASGTVTLSGTGSTGLAAAGRIAYSASATVKNTSVDAAVSAASDAVDAANEATDAANAATDAANAAAEAADAATAAAQDAQAAVAALASQVAELMADLKAQITALTNLVIKIQKKVKA